VRSSQYGDNQPPYSSADAQRIGLASFVTAYEFTHSETNVTVSDTLNSMGLPVTVDLSSLLARGQRVFGRKEPNPMSMGEAVTHQSDIIRSQGIATINQPDLSRLSSCVKEVMDAVSDTDPGPADPTNYSQLRGRLEAVRNKLPPLYRDSFVLPYIETLDTLRESGFTRILIHDPYREGTAGLMLDAAQAILQQGEEYQLQATDAFQEVVSDLYDGFLSAEDRRGVKEPDKGVIPPLVKWGCVDCGPYTWPIDAAESLRVKAGIVNLPPYNSRQGLLAWAALGHETCGHDILGADTGLREELATAVYASVVGQDGFLAEYWVERIDETASDVMGILNMGPAAGVGLVGYFRGLNAAYGGTVKLRNNGPGDDPHPADILRGYLAAEVISLLKFTGKTLWAKALLAEIEKDLEQIILADTVVDPAKALASAKAVAKAVASNKCKSLEGHSLLDIQNWRDTDERYIRRVRTALRNNEPLREADTKGLYAAHVVSGAVIEAIASGNVASSFKQMLGFLKTMHDKNPSWGPLYVRHPGDMTRHLGYHRQAPALTTATVGAAE
jgi:hypothetical protein